MVLYQGINISLFLAVPVVRAVLVRGNSSFWAHAQVPSLLSWSLCLWDHCTKLWGSWRKTLAYIFRMSHLSHWLLKSSSVVDILWWSLIWDTKIWTLCARSHRSSYTAVLHIFLLHLMGPSSKKLYKLHPRDLHCIGMGEKYGRFSLPLGENSHFPLSKI